MTLQELQNQALQLPIDEGRSLVQSLLRSIQQETLAPLPPSLGDTETSLTSLDPWTQSLIGVIPLEDKRSCQISRCRSDRDSKYC